MSLQEPTIRSLMVRWKDSEPTLPESLYEVSRMERLSALGKAEPTPIDHAREFLIRSMKVGLPEGDLWRKAQLVKERIPEPRSESLGKPHWGTSFYRSDYCLPYDAVGDSSNTYPWLWVVSCIQVKFVEVLAEGVAMSSAAAATEPLPSVMCLLHAVADPVEDNRAHAVIRLLGSYADEMSPSPFASTDVARSAVQWHLARHFEAYPSLSPDSGGA